MDIVYRRSTSDGVSIAIWEDGFVTSGHGYKLPGIGKRKLPSGSLAVFAEEVTLFSEDELWALVEATRRLGTGGSSILPGNLRKLALSLLTQKAAGCQGKLASPLDVARNLAREILQQSGDIDEAILATQNHLSHGFEVMHTEFGEVATKDVLETLQALRPEKHVLTNEDYINVHHTTDENTAKRLLSEGFIPESKPSNLARERYEKGEEATFAPGRGLSRGLYVGKPGTTSGFGRVTLNLRVPKAWLSLPPEETSLGGQSVDDALETEHGAVITRSVPPSLIKRVARITFKV